MSRVFCAGSIFLILTMAVTICFANENEGGSTIDINKLTGNIYFHSDREGQVDIYRLDLNNGNTIWRLTDSPAIEAYPRVSPDGKRIVFESTMDKHRHLYMMNIDGTGLRRLTFDESNNRLPDWAPYGSIITWHSNKPGHWQLYVMDVDTGTESIKRIMKSESNDGFADFRSNSEIVFCSQREDGLWSIYKASMNGTVIRLTNLGSNALHPEISPDNSKILYQSDIEGTWHIYVMNIDGSNKVRLTETGAAEAYSWTPAWSPSGEYIVYRCEFGNLANLWVMKADGTSKVQLTSNGGKDGYPSWGP